MNDTHYRNEGDGFDIERDRRLSITVVLLFHVFSVTVCGRKEKGGKSQCVIRVNYGKNSIETLLFFVNKYHRSLENICTVD